MSRAQEILTKAAERIERDGLNKGGYYEGYGDGAEVQSFDQRDEILREGKTPAVDWLGAIHLSAGDVSESDNAIGYVYSIFGVSVVDLMFAPTNPVVEWNDAPQTTATEVAELLRKAAELAA